MRFTVSHVCPAAKITFINHFDTLKAAREYVAYLSKVILPGEHVELTQEA